MFLSSLLSKAYAVESFEPIALWTTVGLIAAAILAGLIVFLVKRKAFGTYAKYAVLGVAAYLLVLAIVFFALDIAKNYSDSYAEKNWLDKQTLIRFVLVPLLALCGVCLIGLVGFTLVARLRPTAKKPVGIAAVSLCGAALLAALVCIAIYYHKKIANDGYYNSDSASVKQIALYVSAVLAVGVIVGSSFLDKRKLVFTSRSLAYAGICAAMSFALSYVKLWDMPNGGSVTLVSLLPVMLYAYIFGAKKGVFVGFAYGLLQAVQDPWLIHPAQFLLDYPVAFAAAGLAGLFANLPKMEKVPQVKFLFGALVAGTMRFVCHVLSGALAFEAYAEGQNAWLYSLAYNSYVFVDVALVIAAGAVALCSKAFIKTIAKADKVA